jgi:hypothetical protein
MNDIHFSSKSNYETEEWRKIPNFTKYEVSNLGRLRSWHPRPFVHSIVEGPKILSGGKDKDGYKRAVLIDDKGKRKSLRVTEMMAVTWVFRPETEEKLVMRHLDGNRTNNAASNLKWGTHKENIADKDLHGTKLLGEKHPGSILKENEVVEIFKSKDSVKNLSLHYGVHPGTIWGIKNKINWKHITKKL